MLKLAIAKPDPSPYLKVHSDRKLRLDSCLTPSREEAIFFRVAADKETEAADETNFEFRVGSTVRALATRRNIFKVRTLPHLQSYLSVASYL